MVRTDATRRLIWLGADRDNGAGSAAPAEPVQFEVDRVLTPAEDQAAVYNEVAQPVVEAVALGATGCIMCYGQTGSGKTYTLAGGGGGAGGGERGEGGIVERTLRQLLPAGAAAGAAPLRMAYVQVYMELLQDLVRPESAVQLREHPESGVFLEGVAWRELRDFEGATREVRAAEARRATAFTKLNADSSRSHALLLLSVPPRPAAPHEELPPGFGGAAGAPGTGGAGVLGAAGAGAAFAAGQGGVGRLYLVDLAGSERTKRSGVEGQGFDEACSINQSLTTLGRCIQLLAVASHGKARGERLPFRESKLTRLLSPALGGSGLGAAARTTLVCCVSPSAADRHETLSTLEFGANAARVLVKAQRTMGVDYRLLAAELQVELDARALPSLDLEAEMHARLHAAMGGEIEAARTKLRAAEQAAAAAAAAATRELAEAEAEAAALRAELHRQKAELEELRCVEAAAPRAPRPYMPTTEGGGAAEAPAAEAPVEVRPAAVAEAEAEAARRTAARLTAALEAAERDREALCAQLQSLQSLQSPQATTLPAPAAKGESAGGAPRRMASGTGTAAGLSLEATLSAAAVEVGGLTAELEARRGRLEELGLADATAAAAAAGGGGTGGGVSAGNGAAAAGAEALLEARRCALHALHAHTVGLLGALGGALSGGVERLEAAHRDLWQGTAAQLAMVEQLRATRRLCHLFKHMHKDFSAQGSKGSP